jgi:hypothetical protein
MPPIKINRVPCSFSLLKSKTPNILAGNILQRFSDLLQRVASINTIPQTRVICVVAYLQAADWIDRLVS